MERNLTVTNTQTRPSNPGKRPFILLLVAIIVVVAGWSGAWLFGRSVLADQIEQQVNTMSGQGLDVSCDDLAIAGYPFRFEVYCTGLRSEAQAGMTGSLGRLNAVALVYNPWHVIFEAGGPATVSAPLSGPSGDFSWKTARASIRFSSTSLAALDAVVEEPQILVADPVLIAPLVAAKAEFHLREAPETDDMLEAFVSLDALELPAAQGDLPALDLRGHLRIPNGAGLLAGSNILELLQLHGGPLPLDLVHAEAQLAEGRARASGDLFLNGDGTLSGKLDLALSDVEALLQVARRQLPPGDTTFDLWESAIKSLPASASAEDGAPTVNLEIVLDRGTVRLGFLTLGVIPPLL